MAPDKVVIITVIFIISLSCLPLRPDGLKLSSHGAGQGLKERQKVLGSRPPLCINKCFNCRPCMATLVIPSHQRRSSSSSTSSSHEADDTYYLLSWKCKCGDKLFQP